MAKNKSDEVNSFEGLFLSNENITREQADTITPSVPVTKGVVSPAYEQNLTTITVQPNNSLIVHSDEKIAEESEIRKNMNALGRPKTAKETKRRTSMAFYPSIYKKLEKIAFVDRTSVNAIIDKFMEEYVEKNKEKLLEYERIKRKNK